MSLEGLALGLLSLSSLPLKYHAYGELRHPEVMKALLGRLPEYRNINIPTDCKLAVQRLEHIADEEVKSDDVVLRPRTALREIWGDDFLRYALVWDDQTRGKYTPVTEWEVTREEYYRIKAFRLIPWSFKLYETGLHCNTWTEYPLTPDHDAEYEIKYGESRYAKVPELLMPLEQTLAVAEKFRTMGRAAVAA